MKRFSTKLIASYFTGMGVYGFYRGYNNLFRFSEDFNKQETLIVDRIVSGLFRGLQQANPAFQPYFIYKLARRSEKTLRDQPLTQED